mmetsp:Transcript_3185/g.12291  ORF Transcript_3185/g.12291 Transcript_3185/m.12291 type:complete len:210 (+) Transcript_3185:401-1030(+)
MEAVGKTSPKGFAELWLVVVAAVDARMTSSSSLSKLSAVCVRVAATGAASRARDATSPAAAFTSKSYRSISLVNSSFKCMALASKPSSSAFEISSIRRGCIARHCSESSFAKLDGDGGRRATQPSRTCVNTLSEFVATAMSPFNFSTSCELYVVDTDVVARDASAAAVRSLSRSALCNSLSARSASRPEAGGELRCGARTGVPMAMFPG